MDIFLVIVGIILLLTGIIGSVMPVVPGPPISFVGMLLLRFTRFVEPGNIQSYTNLLWIFAGVSLIVVILDYLVPIWGTRKFGGSKAGTWGAAIGVVVGIFFGPAGLILGPFLGAFIGEMISGKDQKSSLKAGFGSLIGFLFGVALKISVTVLMSFYFFKELIV